MPWPNTAKCHRESLEDPSLLSLSPMQECTPLWELPLMGALHFRLISDRLFACIASPDTWGKTRVEPITETCPRISREAAPMAILIIDGVGEENQGMVTIFCHHDQNKMEASDALSALCQYDSPEPSVTINPLTHSPSPYRWRHSDWGRIGLWRIRLQPSPSKIAGL